MEKLNFGNIKVNKEELIEGLFQDPSLSNFFIENDLNAMVIEDYLSNLLAYKIEKDLCVGCAGLNECKQDAAGLEPLLKYENDKIKTFHKECKYSLIRTQEAQKDGLISAMYMPKMIFDASFEDYDTNTPARMEIYKYMMSFIRLFPMGEKVKGLYIWGEYQKGKTYTLASLANELIKKGYTVVIAYYPDLVREFKSSISTGGVEKLISKLKQADIVMLDDIGGEGKSAWIRDEVLGPILQYRLLDEKPTFFSSNVSRKELASYMVDNNQKAEQMKAFRIVSRIISLTEEVKM
ncbi:MAG: primosomal protein DnaI [Candidatus Izimaplasma sp.]|nr:primosomal protein DnaI [Candidatus Izimaplasma bacterium]